MRWCRRTCRCCSALFPAILMALAIVREKELGSITNLYVTPVTRLEFLIGKQLPYIGVALANFTLMFLMALFVFQVPLKGSFPALLLGVLIYVTAMTAYGMLISAFTQHPDRRAFRHRHSDGAAGDAVRGHDDAGVLARRPGRRSWAARFPMTYFVPISVGTFTKGLGFLDLGADLAALAVFVPVLTLMNVLLLRKQER